MSNVGQPERAMQSRVDALFRDELGYGYLGDWTERDGSCNIEDSLLTGWLRPEDLEHWRILRRNLMAELAKSADAAAHYCQKGPLRSRT